jgi:hypothetical protein
VLRIPAEWLDQPMRCKHCGMTFQARPTTAVAAAPYRHAVLPPPGRLGSRPAATMAARPAPRSVWVGPLVILGVLAVAGVLTAVLWPHLRAQFNKKEVAQGPPAPEVPADQPKPPDKPNDAPPPADKPKDPMPPVDKPKDPTPPADKPKDPTPPVDKPKDTPPPPVDKPKDRPPPPVDKPKDPPRPPDNLTSPAGNAFPRRALVISVNDYLYLNPVTFGDTGSRNVAGLVNSLRGALRIERDQVALLSDAAPDGAGCAPVKPVLVNTISSFLASSRAQDRVLLLFLGHAAVIDDEAYLVPIDGDPKDKATLIPLDWLYQQLADCKARQKVLVLDVCRVDPGRGTERAGGDPMDEKLDARLQAPPPGVQVWSACVAGQNSYEISTVDLRNGVFAEALQQALLKDLEGSIQRPEQPLPMDRLLTAVNRRMKALLDPQKKVQTSRLTGQETNAGAASDPAEPSPARVTLSLPPPPTGGAAKLDIVQSILREIDVLPVRPTKDQRPLRPEALPVFDARVLDLYRLDLNSSPLRDAVEKARKLLNEQIKSRALREEWRAPANENQLKEELRGIQMKTVAVQIQDLEIALEELRALEEERAQETKRWQANYDYILSRMEARLAYIYDYTSLLGQMRQALPPREEGHDGWRMIAVKKPTGDKSGKRAADRSNELLKRLIKEHPGTPWEVLARRDSLANLGLDWQSVKGDGR